jgi:hypothetical protein
VGKLVVLTVMARHLCCLTSAIFVIAGMSSCDESGQTPAPPPIDALRVSRVIAVEGMQVRFVDGSVVTLSEVMPRCLVQSPGLFLTDVEHFEGGLRINATTGEPPGRLSALLNDQIVAAGWLVVSAAESDTRSNRSYRRGETVLDVILQSEGAYTTVTAQIGQAL